MHFLNWRNKPHNVPSRYRIATYIWLTIVMIVAIIMMSMWWQKSIHIQSDILKLLPNLAVPEHVLDAQQKVNQQLNRNAFIMLQSQDKHALDKATQQLEQAVAQSTLWQPLQKNNSSEQFASTLYQQRTGLLDTQSRQFLQQGQYDALLEKSMLQMLNPIMPIHEQMLKDDPLLLFPQYLMQQAQSNQANIELEQGWATHQQVLSDDENPTSLYSRLIALQLTQSPYNIDYQQQTHDWLKQIQQQIQAQSNEKAHQVSMIWSGTLAFATFGTQSAEHEISTIGLGSSIGIILLVLFGFRSVRPLFTEFIAVSVGTLMAFAITHWLFAEVHLMTLVFGASLIGACVDFSFYFMALQSQYRDKNGFSVLTPVLPSLFLGLMTTILAYLFLTLTPFPAFKQISVFSMVGLFSAWVTSILLLPRLPALNAQPALNRLAFLQRSRVAIVYQPKRRYAIIAFTLIVSAFGLSHIQFNDDVRNLQSADPTLIANDKKIRELFSAQGSSEYFIISGNNASETEQAEMQLLDQLSTLQQQGKIATFQAVGQWYNTQLQQQNIELLQKIPVPYLQQYAQAMQIPLAQLQQWQQQLPQQATLNFDSFKTHPLAQLILSEHERVVLLHGIHDKTAVQALQNNHVYFMQPTTALSEQFALHRQQAQWLLFGAILSLAILIGILYGYRSILPIMLPVSLALALTFAIQAILNVQLNLFSIMGCFLILGIGVDYAIFYRHAGQRDDVVSMALFLCMLSTLLGFGLLSLSNTYAIFCFGFTVLCGVILSYLFASYLTPVDQDYFSKGQYNEHTNANHTH